MIGEVIGKYRVSAELGRGGMGVVYVAEHLTLGSRVALKMLLPELSANRTALGRFFNEARAASKIKHAGIVSVIDFGEHTSGSAYLVMEMLDGETLAQRRRRAPALTVRGSLLLGRQIARAVAAAHAEGIVHRDLKPPNVFLVAEPDLPGGVRVKVLDFGIAKLSDERNPVQTGDHSVIGTPRYMSPEQCRGAARVDHRADVYALGCMLYELVAGEPPFVGEGAGELIAKHIFEPPVPLATRVLGVAPALDAFVSRCLAKEPGERPQSMVAVCDELDRLIEDAPEAVLTPTLPPRQLAEAGGTATSGSRAVDLPSTLGASAAQITPRGRRAGSRWLLVGGLLVAGVVGVLVLRKNGQPVAALTAVDAAPVVPVLPVLIDATPPPPRRESVTLTITSEPAGAVLLRAADEGWFGQTPLRGVVPAREGQIDLLVRKKGFAEQRVSLRTDEDGSRHVVLSKLGRPGKAEAPPAVIDPPPVVAPRAEPPDAGVTILNPFRPDAGG